MVWPKAAFALATSDPPTLVPIIFVIEWTLGIITLIATGLRLYSKYRIVRSVRSDDWFSVSATVILTVSIIVHTLACIHSGLGLHMKDMVPRPINKIDRILFVMSVILYPVGAFAVRTAVLVFLCRLNPYEWLGVLINMALFYNVGTTLGTLGMIFFRCTPVAASFTPGAFGYRTAKCMPANNLTISTIVLGVLADIMTWLLPAMLIWQVRTTPRKKLAMIILLCWGMVACMAGIARIPLNQLLVNTGDISWDLAPSVVATTIEISIGILAASAPAIKHLAAQMKLFDSCFERRPRRDDEQGTDLPEISPLVIAKMTTSATSVEAGASPNTETGEHGSPDINKPQ